MIVKTYTTSLSNLDGMKELLITPKKYKCSQELLK